MTDNEKQFEDFVRQIKFDDSPDPEHRNKLEQDLLAAMAKQPQHKESSLKIWRTIMKNRITKLATAAAIILIVVLGITVLEKSAAPAWAIEQTIEALERFNGVQITGVAVPEDGNGLELNINLWARANEERTESSDFLLETSDGRIIEWVQEDDTYHYEPDKNTVWILRGQKARIGRWLGRESLQRLQYTEDTQVLYGRDAETNRDRVFVIWCSDPSAPVAQSYWFEFDFETKLPVSFKQWDNLYHEGKPAFHAQRIIYYEDLPDDLFEFEIPEGATVIEKKQD